jgi:heme-degrading monooxygenase HmoA
MVGLLVRFTGQVMIVTVFRNRLKPEHRDEYLDTARRMSELARAMPGHVSHKTFTAEDGERVTIVEFADEASHRAWAMHPEHVGAKGRGREAFYSEYSIQVCRVQRASRFTTS